MVKIDFTFKKQISMSTVLRLLLVAGALPVLFVFIYFFVKYNSVSDMKTKVEMFKERRVSLVKKNALDLHIQEKYRNADRLYLSTFLEGISFLEKEIDQIETFLKEKPEEPREALKETLAHLKGKKNRLVFSEGSIQSYGSFQEKIEKLQSPVEINIEDLRKLLSYVEDKKIGENEPPEGVPQLVFINFKLQRKQSSFGAELFLLDMEILSREFL